MLGCESANNLADAVGGGAVQPKFSSLYGDFFSNCSGCHAPDAPGKTSNVEPTLNFSSASTAYSTLTTGSATGLQGNAAGCNGTPFLTKGQPGKSLVVAVLDAPTRQAFDDSAHPNCDQSAISDMTVKVGSQPSGAFVSSLKQWITDGAPNN